MIKEKIGNRIKEIRLFTLKISQEELATKIGCDRTFLSRVESGKQNITIENLYGICLGLNVSLSTFFEPFSSIKIEGNQK